MTGRINPGDGDPRQRKPRQCRAEGCENILPPIQWRLSKNKFCATCNARIELEKKRREGR